MVLPVPASDDEEFFSAFTKMLNRNNHTMVDGLDGKTLEELSADEILGSMAKKDAPVERVADLPLVEDGILIKTLRKAMEDHPQEVLPGQSQTTVWVKMSTGRCSP